MNTVVGEETFGDHHLFCRLFEKYVLLFLKAETCGRFIPILTRMFL